MFHPAPLKLTIGSLDDLNLTVVAQYNPKEIDLAKGATWTEHDALKFREAEKGHDLIDLEYTGNPATTMSLELLFDGYEAGKSIEPKVRDLQRMASPDVEMPDRAEGRDLLAMNHRIRPHRCVVVWNDRGIPKFECVIESVAIKYTMFSKDGFPLRAVCNVKLKEANVRTLR